MPVQPYTVFYDVPGDIMWRFFECHAVDGDDAEARCVAHHPDAGVVWVNEGHGPESRIMQGMEE